jgi:hypothetical protein
LEVRKEVIGFNPAALASALMVCAAHQSSQSSFMDRRMKRVVMHPHILLGIKNCIVLDDQISKTRGWFETVS